MAMGPPPLTGAGCPNFYGVRFPDWINAWTINTNSASTAYTITGDATYLATPDRTRTYHALCRI